MPETHGYSRLNDTEHQWIDDACDEISQHFMAQPFDLNETIKSLGTLKASMLLHYAEEELIMAKSGYQAAASHRRAHDYFFSEVSSLLELIKDGPSPLLGTKWQELLMKFDHHVKTHDENLMVHINLSQTAIHNTQP